MREGNEHIRIPVAAGKGGPVAYAITALASGPRKAYGAKKCRFTLNSSDALVTGVQGGIKAVFNLAEETGGTLFLVVGDEVEVWSQSGRLVCYEIPRGFLRQ